MRPAETSRGEWKRSHRRMSRVSLLLLFLEAPVLLALIVLLDPTAETVESMTASLALSSPFDVILGAISGALPTYADIALWGTLMWLGVCALGIAVMRYGSGGHRSRRSRVPGGPQPGTSMRCVPITASSRSASCAGEPGSAV